MSDDLPGFINDEPKKKPSAPAKPAGGGFNAFDDVEVESNPLGVPTSPSPAPAKKASAPTAPSVKVAPSAKTAPSEKAAPAAKPGFDAFANDGSANFEAEAAMEAEIKPGQGKDLWACPHCGAKNRPERTTCRECNKDPNDEVVIAFMQTPAGKFGVPAGGVFVLIILYWLIFGGSVSMVTATVSHIDSSVRRGGSVGDQSAMGNNKFQPKERVAVCGRVIDVGSRDGMTVLVLALGSDGKNEEAVAAAHVDFNSIPPVVSPELKHVTVYGFGNVPSASKGDIISLVGEKGRIIRDGVYVDEYMDEMVVNIKQAQP